MKIIVPDKANRSDGSAYQMLQMLNIKMPILLLSRVENLEYNKEEVEQLKGKDYIIFDYIENGWDWQFDETLLVGYNTYKFTFLQGTGWVDLDEFIRANPPKLYFKRELLSKDASDKILPCEYPNWQPEYPLEGKLQFDNRPISVFFYWGRSHEARLMLHGEIWKNAAKKGYTVCDNIYHLNSFMHEERNNPNKWVTLHMPHYGRVDMKEIMKINAMSKLSISLPGCGIKCFRSTGESLVNSILVLPYDKLKYSTPFIQFGNCIKFETYEDVTGLKKEWNIIQIIERALGEGKEDLYQIYRLGLETAKFYRVDNYVRFLENQINKA